MDYMCFVCKKEFEDIKNIFNHLKSVHNLKNNKTQLFCVVNNNCTKSYHNFDSLRVHLKQCVRSRPFCEVNNLKFMFLWTLFQLFFTNMLRFQMKRKNTQIYTPAILKKEA